MPNTNPSQSTPAKPASTGADGGSAKAIENQPPTTNAAGVVPNKARHVGGETSESLGEARHTLAEKIAPERLEHAARSAFSGAKEQLTDAQEETATRLHQAHDAAAQSYRAVRERALDIAHDVNERAHALSHDLADDTRHAWTTTRQFVTTHALPLTMIGVGLSRLALSLQRESRRGLDLPSAPRLPRDAGASRRSASRAQGRRQPPLPPENPDAYAAAMTTSGAKLMGVRPRQPEI